jgi:hypothetical protein
LKTRRRAFETFAVADMAKPRGPEAASITLSRIEQCLKDVTAWSDENVCLAVTDERRRRRFTHSSWGFGTVELDDLAVWPGMGGLPSAVTCGSALDTARRIRESGMPKRARRLRALVEAARTDPVGIERVCRALPLIAVEYDRLFQAHCRSIPWALDDGSHRAVVLALISARTNVDVLIGMRQGEP